MSDHLVYTSNGVQLRRIVYTNPEDGVTYTYLTNDFTLPAYLIVLYKHRWDIEKIFHELKSKMINSALTRATQRTQRFIRWVRVRLYLDAPWSDSMARLRELWTLPA